ncbi:MAG: ATP-binding cassette domain-containing protein [Chloroflexota bacterium]|nr:ATP-binding cassette domain-containing protein [Anaerolineae bacterium]
MSEDYIRIENLTYQYADTDVPALQEVNLEISKGEYVAIVGPCGAGKTTLCLTLNGIVPKMFMGEMVGRVTVGGMNTVEHEVREIALLVGMVFDNPEFQLSQMSVEEEIALGLESRGIPREEIRRRISEVLDIVGLAGYEERSPMALSGGQQQRLAIAAALAIHPDILVLDEPTSNLDPIGKQEVFEVCARLNRESGTTIIIAEHEVEVMALYADKIFVLNEGRIVLGGTPREVFSEVDALQSIGLRVPQVTALAHILQMTAGKWDGEYPITVDEAVETIQNRWKESAHA